MEVIKIINLVMFSTGLSSAVLLDKVQKEHGQNKTFALMTDTLWEDEDNYRFGNQVINYLKAKLLYVADGRTPEEVWFQSRFLVGPYGAPCTRILKVEQTIKTIKQLKSQTNDDISLYFGINADEEHRTYGLIKRYEPFGVNCEFPLVSEPMHQLEMTDLVQQKWGLRRPRMYDLGFKHANCGGRCVKAGQEHFLHLLKVWPHRFKQIADIEQRFQQLTGGDTTILRVQREGERIKLPLYQLQAMHNDSLSGQLELTWESETPCECMA